MAHHDQEIDRENWLDRVRDCNNKLPEIVKLTGVCSTVVSCSFHGHSFTTSIANNKEQDV